MTAMMQDCHAMLRVRQRLAGAERFQRPPDPHGPLAGQRLGHRAGGEPTRTRSAGLIVESGFACAGPLLRLLGVDPAAIGFREEPAFRHIDKIAQLHETAADHPRRVRPHHPLFRRPGALRRQHLAAKDPAQDPGRQPQRHPRTRVPDYLTAVHRLAARETPLNKIKGHGGKLTKDV
ncbi:MAG: hypothetical protein MZV70_21135 [Desulfobacterales bacterium]|nr:hypothetical protein [Desulfobacterales bacterium]